MEIEGNVNSQETEMNPGEREKASVTWIKL